MCRVGAASCRRRDAVVLTQPFQQPQVGGGEEEVGHHPCHRVGIADTQPRPCRHQPEAHAAAGDHLHHAAHHAQVAVTEPLDAVPQDDEHAQCGVEPVGDAHQLCRIGDHLLLASVDEEHHHFVGERIDDGDSQDEVDHHDAHGVAHAGLHTVQPPCPDVLSAVGRHGDADVLQHAGEEVLDADGGRERGHIDRSEGVVGTLQHDDADGGDGELQPHRHAVVQQDADFLVVEGPLVSLRNEYRQAAADEPPAQPRGEGLAQEGGDARSFDSHSQQEDEHDIQQDVQKRRCDEEVERLLGVAQRADLSRIEVVGDGEGDGAELQEEEDVGIVEDIGRRVDELQDLLAEQAREQGRHQCEHDGDTSGVAHVAPHLVVVAGAEGLCHGDGKACTGTVAEAHDEEHDAARGPHGGQCAHADPPSYDGGVDDEVHLLQEVAEDERYGELQDGACGCAACHALCVLRKGCFYVCQCFCCSLPFFSVVIFSRPANLRKILE